MTSSVQRNITLLLARDLATNLGSALFIVDAAGELVYFNEPAEEMVGRPFSDAGPLGPEEWGMNADPEDAQGNPLKLDDLPLMVALREGRPAHGVVKATMFDGTRRTLHTTAFPLIPARGGGTVGAAALFWEDDRQG